MIPKNDQKRIVVIGGGFAGMELVRRLRGTNYQVLLIDQYNYHQFQPLFYQVATSGLESSSIVFPFRRNFQRTPNVHFRLATVDRIDSTEKCVYTNIGTIEYDFLVIASGAGNNFFGMKDIEKEAYPMKSLNEALTLRNAILERFEDALSVSEEERKDFLTFVIAGAGPTGVELAGTLAEMRRFILPKDYPELNFSDMRIVLVEGSERVLSVMSEYSSGKTEKYLKKLGVEVRTGVQVSAYDNKLVHLNTGEEIRSHLLIWAAGIRANAPEGLSPDVLVRGNRVHVNGRCELVNEPSVFAIGDVAWMDEDPNFPEGHPQLAQVAIQQGRCVAANFKRMEKGKATHPFRYKNLGTMATVGRNKAVVELPRYHFAGFFAWIVWMLVHLRSILGIKNKFIVFLNWVWNYFTYNLSLRLIIKRNDKV